MSELCFSSCIILPYFGLVALRNVTFNVLEISRDKRKCFLHVDLINEKYSSEKPDLNICFDFPCLTMSAVPCAVQLSVYNSAIAFGGSPYCPKLRLKNVQKKLP